MKDSRVSVTTQCRKPQNLGFLLTWSGRCDTALLWTESKPHQNDLQETGPQYSSCTKLRGGLLERPSGNISRPNASPTLLQLQHHRYRNVGPVALPGGHFLYSSNKSRWKPNGEKRNPLHCAREMPRHNEMSRIQGPRERRQIQTENRRRIKCWVFIFFINKNYKMKERRLKRRWRGSFKSSYRRRLKYISHRITFTLSLIKEMQALCYFIMK